MKNLQECLTYDFKKCKIQTKLSRRKAEWFQLD